MCPGTYILAMAGSKCLSESMRGDSVTESIFSNSAKR